MKVYGNCNTNLRLTKKAEDIYSVTDPIKIIEWEDGSYSIREFDHRDGMTAQDVIDYLEELADEIAGEDSNED